MTRPYKSYLSYALFEYKVEVEPKLEEAKIAKHKAPVDFSHEE